MPLAPQSPEVRPPTSAREVLPFRAHPAHWANLECIAWIPCERLERSQVPSVEPSVDARYEMPALSLMHLAIPQGRFRTAHVMLSANPRGSGDRSSVHADPPLLPQSPQRTFCTHWHHPLRTMPSSPGVC